MFNVQDSVNRDPIRVMVVDDSAVIRGFLVRALSADSEITVITTAANGLVALNYVKKYDIDVLILDIEMPEMDGMTALPELLKTAPDLKIIMVSALTHRNAPAAIKALSLGASDYIEKPSATNNNNIEHFNKELINKVKSLGYSSRIIREHKLRKNGDVLTPIRSDNQDVKPSNTSIQNENKLKSNASLDLILNDKKEPLVTIRKNSMMGPPLAIAIACSTGGPQALQKFFSGVSKNSAIKSVPIFITQHMPALFTSYLAEHIQKTSGLPAGEGINGEAVAIGRVYVAPGDFHMEIQKGANGNIINITKNEPENYCRPSADPMLRSLAKLYKSRLLTVVLSGMGHDGLAGAKEVVTEGGAVIVQDEASSVIWGMPGAVAKANLASAILPIEKVADFVLSSLTSNHR